MSETSPPPPPPAIDQPDQLEDLQINAVIVDISEARREMARDASDERLAAESQAGGGLMGLGRRIWKGNLAHEYYRQKYYHEALDEIDQSQNLYVNEEGDVSSETSLSAVVERYASDYDEVIHTEAGETRTRLSEINEEPANDVKSAIRELIRSYADGELDDDNFEEEKNRTLAQLAGNNRDLLGAGLMYADNLHEVARTVREAASHGRGVAEILDDAEITVGEAKLGARTEARFNKTDKLIEKLHSTKLGSTVNETTIATAAAIIACATKTTTQRTIGAAAKVTGVFGLGGAIIGGLRESKRIKEERSLHSREMATGKLYQAGAKRREELETARYQTRGAEDLSTNLLDYLDENGKLGEVEQSEYMQAVALLGESNARTRISDTQDVDLISFSDISKVETERLELDIARVRVQEALREKFDDTVGDWLQDTAEIGSFDELLEVQMAAFEAQLDVDIQAKDQLFKSIHRSHVVKAAITGAVIGGAIALGSQELMAHLPGVGDQMYGVGEHAPVGENGAHKTLLNSAFEHLPGGGQNAEHATQQIQLGKASLNVPEGLKITPHGHDTWEVVNAQGQPQGTLSVDHTGLLTPGSKESLAAMGFHVNDGINTIPLSGGVHETMVGGEQFVLPKEFNLQEVSPGQWNITGPGEQIMGHFTVGPDGHITQESIAALHAGGIDLATASRTVTEASQVNGLSSNELVQNHLDQTTKVNRVLWYNNNTSAYDLNELKTWAGGANGSWFDDHGNVVLDVSHMSKDGSFAMGQHANPFEVTGEGKLSLAISASKDTQANVFQYNFSTLPDGRTIATIPPDSPIHQLFQMQGDQRVFNGGYFEVMENTGTQDAIGEQVKILGTFVGTNNANNLTDTIAQAHQVNINTLNMGPLTEHIQNVTFEAAPTEYVEAVPIIPIRSRASLERATRIERQYYGYGANSPEEMQRLEDERSPRLRDNPDAHLNTGEELAWYREQVVQRSGQEYADIIQQNIASSPELQNLPPQTAAIVCIPVAAVSEADNIYAALSLYDQQDPEAKAATTVLLHVNWVDDQTADPAQQAAIDKTKAEIDRARQDFPDLNIASFETQWQRDVIRQRGGVIGDVARRLFDTALLSVEDQIADGKIADDQEVVIIRNDADATGMSADYLGHMISAVQTRDEDGFVGAVRWETETHQDYPGFGVASNFREVMHAITGRPGSTNRVPTIGINTAVRASALAAVGSIGTGKYVGAGSDDLEIGHRLYAAREASARSRGYRSLVSRALYGREGRRRSRNRNTGATAGQASYQNGGTQTSTARPIKYLAATQIDTTADRLLNIYRAGGNITDAWGSFDRGGYQARGVLSSNATLIERDDTRNDMDSVAARIEQNISAMATNWFRDPAYVQAGLRFMFPEQDKNGNAVYELNWENGQCDFSLTDAGKQWLKTRMERDSRGRFDQFGKRARRRLYSEVSPSSRRRPASSRPRLVSAKP